MHRLGLLSVLLVLLFAAPAAAQDANPFDDALPSPSPTVTASPNASDDTSSSTVYLIAGGALLLFVGIGFFITRDARRNLTDEDRRAVERGERAVPAADDERMAGGMRGKQKSKQRKKGKAQRQARKANRPR